MLWFVMAMDDQSLCMKIQFNNSNWVSAHILQHFGRLTLNIKRDQFYALLAVDILLQQMRQNVFASGQWFGNQYLRILICLVLVTSPLVKLFGSFDRFIVKSSFLDSTFYCSHEVKGSITIQHSSVVPVIIFNPLDKY